MKLNAELLEKEAREYANQPLKRSIFEEAKSTEDLTERMRVIERAAFKTGAELGFIEGLKSLGDLKKEIEELKDIRAKCLEEIEILRQFGNKDCTGMADEELQRRNSVGG